MTLKKRLLRGSAGEISVTITEMIIGLIMLPFLLNTLGEHYYGMWLIIGTIVGYFALLNFGLSSAAQRYITKYKAQNDVHGINTVLSNATFIFSIAGGIAMLVSIGIWALGPRFFSVPDDLRLFQAIILLMGVKIALTFPSYGFAGLITANLRHDIKSLISISTLVLRTLAILYWVQTDEDIFWLAVITCITDVVCAAVTVIYAVSLQPGLKISRRFLDKKQGKELFNYSAFSFVIWLSDQMRHSIDNFVIAAHLSLAALAVYAVPLRLVVMANQLLMSLLAVLTPLLTLNHSSGNHELVRRDMQRALEISCCIGFTIAGGILTLGNVFVELWVRQTYPEVPGLLWIFAFITILGTAQSPLISYLYAVNKHKHYALQNTVDGVLNVTLSLILVHDYGLYGVALGTVIPMVLTKLVMQPLLVCRLSGLKKRFFYGLYVKGLIWLLFATALARWVLDYIDFPLNSWLKFAIGAMLTGTLLLVGFYLLLISKDSKLQLKKLFQ